MHSNTNLAANKSVDSADGIGDPSSLSLHHGHHLLKSVVKFNSNQAYQNIQKEKIMNEFNITQRNETYKRIRNCFGFRKSEYEKAMNMEKEMVLN
jgi:hypothetical protein